MKVTYTSLRAGTPVLDRREPCVQLFEYLFRGGTAK